MIRNVIFDMGMVLMHYDPMTACIMLTGGDRETALKLKAAIFDHPEWQGLLDSGKLTDEEYIPLAQERVDTAAEKVLVDQLLRTWWQNGMYPMTGMQELTQKLLDRGLKLFVLSNVSSSFGRYCAKLPNFDRFSGYVISSEEKCCKPDPAIYLRLAEKYGLKPEECVFVDDLPVNVHGAEAVGMHGILHDDRDARSLESKLFALLDKDEE